MSQLYICCLSCSLEWCQVFLLQRCYDIFHIAFTTPFFLPLQLVNSHNFQCKTFDKLSCRFFVYSCLATFLPSLTRSHKLSPFSSPFLCCTNMIFRLNLQVRCSKPNPSLFCVWGFRHISQKLSVLCFINPFPYAFISPSLLNLFFADLHFLQFQ